MKLSRHDIQKLEDYWINLEDYKKQLKYREWELLNPHQEEDTNIGGGKANCISDTTGNRAILLADDEKYQQIKKIISGIELLYQELDKDLKTIVDMRYWDKEGCYEWEDVADTLFLSRNKVLRKRNLLLDKTIDRINYI